jgi:hypothetical protein
MFKDQCHKLVFTLTPIIPLEKFASEVKPILDEYQN